MSIEDVAHGLVALCRAGQNAQAMDRYYAKDIVSVEGMLGTPMTEVTGVEAVKAKSAWWVANHEVHSAACDGPFVGTDGFCVLFRYDITPKATGVRAPFHEVGVYTVQDDRIVREQFYYQAG